MYSLFKRWQKEPKDQPPASQPALRGGRGEWLRAVGTTGAAAVLYLWHGRQIAEFLLSVSILLMAGGLLLRFLGPRAVKIERTVTPARPSAGDSVTVEAHIRLRSRLPLPWLAVEDTWTQGTGHVLLFPGFRRAMTYSYKLNRLSRGVHQIRASRAAWGDPCGWFTGHADAEGTAIVKVKPRPLYYGRNAVHGMTGTAGEETIRSGFRDGGEAADIRDYAPGDPLNRIHWKNTARRGTLQTRTPERQKGRMTCIVLDNRAAGYTPPGSALGPRGQRAVQPEAFELAVSAAYGLLLEAERSGSYVQWFSGGWPEGMPRYEGLGNLPERVADLLTDISADGTRRLDQLLEDASRCWIPGMTASVITGVLEEETAKLLARLLALGVQVDLYYAWDAEVPRRRSAGTGTAENKAETLAGTLTRLGARLYRLEEGVPHSKPAANPWTEPAAASRGF